MASSSRTIPHLLEPYLCRGIETATGEGEGDPELVVATSVLGASTNWLILRYLYSFLKQQQSSSSSPSQQQQQKHHRDDDGTENNTTTATSVVLVSFLRDYNFWKENAGRIGLDLDGLGRAGRFGYVDGLSVDLFHSESGMGVSGTISNNIRGSAVIGGPAGLAGPTGRIPGLSPVRPNPIIPGRQPPVPARGPVPILGGGRIPPSTSTTTATTTPAAGTGTGGGASSVLTNPGISHLRKVITESIEKVRSRTGTTNKVVLIIDQLDFLLAATAGSSGTTPSDEISTQALRDLLLDLREITDKTILTTSADQPLIDIDTNVNNTNTRSTTLEKNHANLVLSLLHDANLVLSLRLLDTGVAKDVSGVIRITAGGGAAAAAAVEENEYLYHIRGDGSVRVFERGQ